jgi:hypothetical protein
MPAATTGHFGRYPFYAASAALLTQSAVYHN